MTDKTTATKAPAKADASDNADKINALADQIKDLLVEDGADPATAEVLTNFARPGAPQIVGNLADLQRMGAIAVTGTMPTAPGVDDVKTTDTGDAFVEPPTAATVNPQPISAEISAAAAKAEEKAQ